MTAADRERWDAKYAAKDVPETFQPPAWLVEHASALPPGKALDLKAVRAKPKPVGGARPLIMNAGASPTGRAFAVKNCDAFFMQASRTSIEETAALVQKAKDLGKAHGQDIGVYSVGVVTCRRTQKEAEEYYRYAILENADFSAIDRILAMKDITPQTRGLEEFNRQRNFYANGMGGLPLIGDPDYVASSLAELSGAGLTGIGLSLINYLDELPFFLDEVLPRLERVGVRERRRHEQAQFA